MKTKIAFAAALSLLLALPSFAQIVAPPCMRGTLASYIAQGAIGCTFDNVLYDNFTYAPPTTSTSGVSPQTIIVTPILLPVAGLSQGLNFSAPWKVAAHQSEQSVIGYRAVPYPPNGVIPPSASLTLQLGQTVISGIIGSVTVTETTSATSTIGPLKVYDMCADGCGIKRIDSVIIKPTQTLQTLITVSLSGGTGGASLNSFASDYAVGPQPE